MKSSMLILKHLERNPKLFAHHHTTHRTKLKPHFKKKTCLPSNQFVFLDPSTPVCGINEIARDCRRICPPQTCLSKYALFRCKENIPCEPGCDCVANYLRDDSGKCVPSEKCPARKIFVSTSCIYFFSVLLFSSFFLFCFLIFL